jgi:hypothetical protein
MNPSTEQAINEGIKQSLSGEVVSRDFSEFKDDPISNTETETLVIKKKAPLYMKFLYAIRNLGIAILLAGTIALELFLAALVDSLEFLNVWLLTHLRK